MTGRESEAESTLSPRRRGVGGTRWNAAGELDVCSLSFVRGRMERGRTGEEVTRGAYFISDLGVTQGTSESSG